MKKLLLISLLFTACYISEELPDDQDVWGYDLPANQQLDQNGLLSLNGRIELEEFGLIEGLTIIRNDELVFENYYTSESNRFSARNIGRTGLLVTLAALGVAIDERFLAVDDSIYRFLPEYAAIFQEDPTKLGIKVQDVLMHRTGLSWNESIERDPNDNDFTRMKRSTDWVDYILSQPAIGVGFYTYNTANGVLLAKIIENATGIDFDSYIAERIFMPMRISQSPTEQDPSGNYNGGDGYSISLIDFTKVAYLYLNEGSWEGRTLVNANFSQNALDRQFQFSQSSINNSIGYFWNFFGEGFQPSLGADYATIVFFVDQRGQSILIAPEEEMIISAHSNIQFGSGFEMFTLFSEITQTISR